jgi:hypothetical protein
MTASFQERFKNKISQIDKLGNFDLADSNPISRPQKNQIFDINSKFPIGPESKFKDVRNSYATPVNELDLTPRSGNNNPADSFPRKQTQSAKPFRNLIREEKKSVKTSGYLPPVEEFKPYTLRDYQNIKPEKYYELGGLGPSTIGSEQWKIKKQIINRRNEYIKQIFLTSNNNLPPSSMRHPIEKLEEKKKPNSNGQNKISVFATPSISSVLEELEKRGQKY